MKRLTHIFNVTNRDQLVDFVQDMATSIEPEFLDDFILTMCGPGELGKSLFWDIFIQTLLKDTAQKDQSRSALENPQRRVYETWVGQRGGTEEQATIFVTNLGYLKNAYENVSQTMEGALDTLRSTRYHTKEDVKALQLGNIAIFSNHTLSCADIRIELLNPDTGHRSKQEWQREIRISDASPRVLNSSQFQQFLGRHCD